MLRTFVFIIFFCVFSSIIYAQELSGLIERDPVKLSGSLSTNHVFTSSSDPNNNRMPYSYVISGSLNTSLYDIINVPLSFTYSNEQFNYSQPFNFNQFGMQPSYKWVKTYIGYNSMVFGKYTMSGHQFLGVGIELTPPKSIFRFSSVYGRFVKAVEEDTLSTSNTPAYRRMGYGFKAGVQKNGNEVYLTIFKAEDKIGSLEKAIIKSDIKPQENLVIGLNGQTSITKNIKLKADIAYSIIARDLFLPEEKNSGLIRFFNFWITNRESMDSYWAGSVSADYNIKGGSIGLQYERIDPGYTTMGAYYFTNDLENIAATFNKQLFKGLLNVSGNVGYERNNLNSKSESTSNRLVTSANVVVVPNNRINVGLNFSNFKSYTHIRSVFDKINQVTPYENIDTLKFTQITTQIGANSSFKIGDISGKKLTQNLSISFDYQKASSLEHSKDDISNFYNGGAYYNVADKKYKLNSTLGINMNYSDLSTGSSFTFGPSLSLSRPFFKKKMKARFSVAYNKSFADSKAISRALMFRCGGSYKIKEAHSFNLNALVAMRKRFKSETKSINEFTVTFGYAYNFSVKNIFSKKKQKTDNNE
jgi:hypothetical protein